MPDINNNSMYQVLLQASAERMGAAPIADNPDANPPYTGSLDLQRIVDAGKTWSDIEKEQWVKTLSAAYVKTYYTDTSYEDRTNDVFFEDEARFGAITKIIGMEMPDIIENRSWINVTSGSTTIGSNTIYLPIVNEQLFASTDSWGVPVVFTGNQLDAAFTSVQGLLEFDAYVRLVAQNAIRYHKATMAGINRNNYIAEKLHVGNSSGKINVVNLVEEYQRDHGDQAMTVAEFFSDPDAIRYSTKTFKKYKALLLDMSTLFTTNPDSRGKFIAYDRFVFQILSDFEGRMEAEVYSGTYHDEFVKLPLYRNVTAWQGLTGANASADFETMSSIRVTTADGHEVDESGIVGFMVDKWAIMHTMVQNRVGYQKDDIKNITMYDYQFTDRYINNLTLPGVVFIVADYTPV